ncbi:MAG: C4-type zinc ribbon domain-containing protein [Myxococcota bacterium]|nr:C4-type zinc ribbon domain-containing protein [Myxococcota bacterium]
MIEGLRQLIDLQHLDEELFAAEEENKALPGRRQELAERREAVQAELEAARQVLRDLEAAQRRAETEVQDAQALLTRLEGQQFQVKSNDAYTALLHEIEQAKEAISAGETRILEAMEALDGARERVAEAEKQAESTLAGVAEQERAADEREKQLTARIAELGELRARKCDDVDAELLAHYVRIGKRRRPVLARVQKETCLGCRVKVPPQTQIELLRGDELMTCTTCHRILIHDRVFEEAEKQVS